MFPLGSSTLPIAKKKLVFRLTNLLHTARVSYGHPGNDFENEHVWVGDSEDWTQEWAAIGSRRREETYNLSLFVVVVRPGDNEEEATDRAFEIWNQIQEDVRDNVTLGESVRIAELTPRSYKGMFTDEGRGVELAATVFCKSRI